MPEPGATRLSTECPFALAHFPRTDWIHVDAAVPCPDRGHRMIDQKWPERLWIVRHGQSAGNVARDAAESGGLPSIDIADRDMDVPLSSLGEQQARALGRWIAEMPAAVRPTVVLSSPYVRARTTAQLVLQGAGME